MRTIRVVIADSHKLFAEGIKAILELNDQTSFRVIGRAFSGSGLLEMVTDIQVDLILMDIRLPDRDGLDILPEVKDMVGDARIIMVSMYNSPKFIKSAFQFGADGYILKDCDSDELFEAIGYVLNGDTYMGTGVRIAPPRNRVANGEDHWQLEDTFLLKNYLTRRELEILTQIAQAKNNKEIAQALYISDQTVSVHRKNIMRKLHVSNTAGLIKIALDHGLVS